MRICAIRDRQPAERSVFLVAALALLFALPLAACKEKAPPAPTEMQPSAPQEEPSGLNLTFALVDSDLAAFEARIDEMRKHVVAETNVKPEKAIGDELAMMVEVDQFTREEADLPHVKGYTLAEQTYFQNAFTKRWQEIDAAHTERVRELIDAHGWITIGRFGVEADQAAWLLVQHADADLPFQKRVLAMLEPLVSSGDTSPENYAYLYDRIAVAENRPQRYGTQGSCVGPGKWEPGALENEAEIDTIRASVGLISMGSYRSVFVDECH